MMPVWKILLWGVFSLGLLLPVYACECEPPESPAAALAGADFAFVGKVVFTNTNWIAGGWKFSFQVEESWKRRTDRLMIIGTPWADSCGIEFRDGERYLVYVEKKFTPRTTVCLGTKPLSEAEADLAYLGKGLAPGPSSLIGPLSWTLAVLGILSVVFMAFVVLHKRRRKT